MKALWVVQKNLGNVDDLLQALDHEKVQHKDVDVIPFSDDLPDVVHDGPVLFYGATGFITKVWMSRRWVPGAFCDPGTFCYRRYVEEWGDLMLNSDARLTTIGEFAKETNHQSDDLFFIRPDSDLKDFAGNVFSFGEMHDWFDKLSCGGCTFGPELSIAVAQATNIWAEYRLWMVEGRCVAATQYRKDRVLFKRDGCRADFVLKAEEAARLWSPAPVFVMDVCEARPDEFKIVEANCFNSAGFYAADVGAIVRAVTNFLEKP
jgi:hypothetical protein